MSRRAGQEPKRLHGLVTFKCARLSMRRHACRILASVCVGERLTVLTQRAGTAGGFPFKGGPAGSAAGLYVLVTRKVSLTDETKGMGLS